MDGITTPSFKNASKKSPSSKGKDHHRTPPKITPKNLFGTQEEAAQVSAELPSSAKKSDRSENMMAPGEEKDGGN